MALRSDCSLQKVVAIDNGFCDSGMYIFRVLFTSTKPVQNVDLKRLSGSNDFEIKSQSLNADTKHASMDFHIHDIHICT